MANKGMLLLALTSFSVNVYGSQNSSAAAAAAAATGASEAQHSIPKLIYDVTFEGSDISIGAYVHHTLDAQATVAAVRNKLEMIACTAATEVMAQVKHQKRKLKAGKPNSFTFHEIDHPTGINNRGLAINDFDLEDAKKRAEFSHYSFGNVKKAALGSKSNEKKGKASSSKN